MLDVSYLFCKSEDIFILVLLKAERQPMLSSKKKQQGLMIKKLKLLATTRMT